MADEKPWLFKKETHSKVYKLYRAKYPPSLFALIRSKLFQASQALPANLQKEYAQNGNGRWKKALDVGCGPGNSTLPLCDFIQETFGIDRSASQIKEAILDYGNRDPSRVTYLQADVQKARTMFEKESFDLVTMGCAAHWMLQDGVFEAAKELLRPGGLLVAYSIEMKKLKDPEADKLVSDVILNFLVPYSDETATKSLSGYLNVYEEMLLQFPDAIRDTSVKLEVQMSADDICNYMKTFSPYQRFLHERQQGQEDKVETLNASLKALGDSFEVTIPYNLLFATKPIN